MIVINKQLKFRIMSRIEKLESLKKMYETYCKVAFKHVLEYYPEYMIMDPFEVIEDYHQNFKYSEFDANCIECFNSLEVMRMCMKSILQIVRSKYYEYQCDLKAFVEDEEVFEYLIKLFYCDKKEYICCKHNTQDAIAAVKRVDDEGFEINSREVAVNIINKLGVEYDTEARGLLRGLVYVIIK